MLTGYAVALFLSQFPFERWIDATRTPPQEHWAIVLPVLVTEPGLLAPPAEIAPQLWVLDTGNRGEAFAWRRHLADAGIDPDAKRAQGRIAITSAVGGKEELPLRNVDLWLVSNVAGLQGTPYRIELHRGLPFRDVPILPDPHFHRPLLGVRALRRARLRVEIDFAHDALSIWTPEEPSHE